MTPYNEVFTIILAGAAAALMGVKAVLDITKNGKSPVTALQLKEAIKEQSVLCSEDSKESVASFKEWLQKVDNKIDKQNDTLNHMNVVISENISNHAARLNALERIVDSLAHRIHE